ncbi:MAG: hypothetical protein OEX07_07950, partial [Gammaproteobacteria bacterium]|nr:hypothetical protein [Gammaproteobacteria bacterium]
MNNTNNIINDFLNSKIDYSSFEQALISDLLKGAPLAQVENNIRDSKLDSILSDDQISLLIQTLHNSLNDKTIIATSGPVDHFASETVAPDEDNDKTVLSNTTQIQENTAEDNDNDKTVLAA